MSGRKLSSTVAHVTLNKTELPGSNLDGADFTLIVIILVLAIAGYFREVRPV